jgi:hypothetical protein
MDIRTGKHQIEKKQSTMDIPMHHAALGEFAWWFYCRNRINFDVCIRGIIKPQKSTPVFRDIVFGFTRDVN